MFSVGWWDYKWFSSAFIFIFQNCTSKYVLHLHNLLFDNLATGDVSES